MRRLFQFRLQSLFVVVTLAAIVALWWSHRLHCLEKAAFHRSEISRCKEQKAQDRYEFVAAYRKQRQREYDEARAESEKRLAEFKSMVETMKLRDPPLHGPSRSLRWEDQSVHDSMAQGFLVVPSGAPDFSRSKTESSEPKDSPSMVIEQEHEKADAAARLLVAGMSREETPSKVIKEPDLVSTYEFKSNSLDREIALHNELANQYLRTIYRPWMRMDESELPATKTPVSAPEN